VTVICVTLAFSVDVPGGSTITLSGLTGSESVGPVSVESSSRQFDNKSMWDGESGTLVISVAVSGGGGELKVGEEYVFSFPLRQGRVASPGNNVTVAASVADPVLGDLVLEPVEMGGDVVTVLGHMDGWKPLYVFLPTLSVKIGHNHHAASVPSLLTITLTMNVALDAGFKVTLTGLTGTSTPDNSRLSIMSLDNHGAFGSSGSFWQATGMLVLTAATGAHSTLGETVIAVQLVNGAVAQSGRSVSVECDLGYLGGREMLRIDRGAVDGNDILQVIVPQDNSLLLGQPNGTGDHVPLDNVTLSDLPDEEKTAPEQSKLWLLVSSTGYFTVTLSALGVGVLIGGLVRCMVCRAGHGGHVQGGGSNHNGNGIGDGQNRTGIEVVVIDPDGLPQPRPMEAVSDFLLPAWVRAWLEERTGEPTAPSHQAPTPQSQPPPLKASLQQARSAPLQAQPLPLQVPPPLPQVPAPQPPQALQPPSKQAPRPGSPTLTVMKADFVYRDHS